MALSTNLKIKNTSINYDAYIAIKHCDISKSSDGKYRAIVKVFSYENELKNKIIEEIKDVSGEELSELNFSFIYDITGENPIKQGYTFLKTKDIFKEAIDC